MPHAPCPVPHAPCHMPHATCTVETGRSEPKQESTSAVMCREKKKVTKPSPSARHGLAVATEEPMEDGYSDGDESPRNGSTGSEALVHSQLC
eukprot:6151871-Prymnesium_polylepis.1